MSVDDDPLSAVVQVTFGAHSRRGRTRAMNEDHYIVMRVGRNQETLMTSLPAQMLTGRFDEYGYAMVVADGTGAPGAGEAASHLAIATLVYLVRHFSKWNLRVDEGIAREIMARAERFYRHVDGTVVAQRREGTASTDQTTLTAAFSAGHDLFFAHVGHSRAYLFRRGHLLQLTRDHTLGRAQSPALGSPTLIDVSARPRDREHILTDTIGMNGSMGPTIDIERLRLQHDDRVLVCTNGLTDSIDETRIAAVLASDQSPDEQSRALVDLTMLFGGDDDTTAVVARYQIPH